MSHITIKKIVELEKLNENKLYLFSSWLFKANLVLKEPDANASVLR